MRTPLSGATLVSMATRSGVTHVIWTLSDRRVAPRSAP
jgi:hypothetical protein